MEKVGQWCDAKADRPRLKIKLLGFDDKLSEDHEEVRQGLKLTYSTWETYLKKVVDKINEHHGEKHGIEGKRDNYSQVT